MRWPAPPTTRAYAAPLPAVLAACEMTNGGSISDASTEVRHRGRSLRSALSTDSARYVQMPPAPPVSSQVLVQEAGSDLAIVPLDSNGNPQVAFWLRGSLDLATATGSLSRTATPFTEGPRQGGHAFYVCETVEATARFRPLIGTPAGGTPGGTVVGAAEQTTSADVFIFRDGGANGTIFTTCVVSDTTSATRGAS